MNPSATPGHNFQCSLRKEVIDVIITTANPAIMSDRLTQKDYAMYNEMAIKHLNDITQLRCRCQVHNNKVKYCLYRHLVHKEDMNRCPLCSQYRQVLSKWLETIRNDKESQLFYTHITKCHGCWKCRPLELTNPSISLQNQTQTQTQTQTQAQAQAHSQAQAQRMNQFSSLSQSQRLPLQHSSTPSVIEESSEYVRVPHNLFYTDEESTDNHHTGYMRIIPLSFENDVQVNGDYKSYLQTLREDADYVQHHSMEIHQIEQREKELQSIVTENYLYQFVPTTCFRGKKLSEQVIKRMSLALKEYLETVVHNCYRGREMIEENDHSISEVDIQRAIQYNPSLINNRHSAF